MSLKDSLRRYLEGQPLIELAVLFGSRARDGGSPDSDVDIGLTLHDKHHQDARRQIEAELGRAAKKDVDVVFLDEAPPLLRFEVARDGQLLMERRPDAWADFKAKAMIDWWDWEPIARRVNRYIIQRLRTMVRPEVLTQKIAKASYRLKNAEDLFAEKKPHFLEDEQKRDLASFYLFLALQKCLDIAAHWMADYGCGPCQSAGCAFNVLAEKHLISPELATQMRLAVRLRNRIAHSYATVGHERLYGEFRSGTKASRQFLDVAAAAVGV